MRKGSPLVLVSSLLLGSALSLLISKPLAPHLQNLFFSSTLPTMSPLLAYQKTFDLVDFAMTGILAVLIYLLNLLILKFSQADSKKKLINSWVFMVFAIAIFIQTHFITSSAKAVVILFAISQLGFAGLSLRKSQKAYQFNFAWLDLLNGVFLGFYALLLSNQLFLLPSLSLLVLLLIPILYASHASILEQKRLFPRAYFPGFLLTLSVISPRSLPFLLCLGAVAIASSFILKLVNFSLDRKFFTRYLYPALAIFLIIYNPLFYLGGFDSVEEGFFLGWLEQLTRGQVLYRDVATYHPPFLIWGIYLFSKISGYSIYSERLFLHLLQVTGGVIYFFFLRKVLKNPFFIGVAFVIYLALTETLVRNNVEIRVGAGLLALLCLFNYFEAKKRLWLILGGVATSVSIFVSVEVGAAALLAGVASLLLLPTNSPLAQRVREAGYYFLGLLSLAIPVSLILLIQGAFKDFLQQTSFYSGVFSKGYFNAPVDRAISLSFFHFHIFDQYLSSTAFYFEFSKFLVLGTVIFYLYRRFTEKTLTLKEQLSLSTAIFALFLTRAALGRSDAYHLLFVLILALILAALVLEKLSEISKLFSIVLALALLFYIFKPAISDQFLEQQIFKLQTYGTLSGDYKEYNFARGKGALFDKDQNTTDVEDLVKAIDSQTSADQRIFVYPWNPELYFFTDRLNATKINTPYAFFSQSYQQEMITELNSSSNPVVIYNKGMNFGNLSTTSLPEVNNYLLSNFKSVKSFGDFSILEPKP